MISVISVMGYDFFSSPLMLKGELKGVLSRGCDGCMNPLRLAALDASPFCFAKRGGNGVLPLSPVSGETLPLHASPQPLICVSFLGEGGDFAGCIASVETY